MLAHPERHVASILGLPGALREARDEREERRTGLCCKSPHLPSILFRFRTLTEELLLSLLAALLY